MNPETAGPFGGWPGSLPELIEALQALRGLAPVERAAAAAPLIDAAKGVLARERAAAMIEAVTGPESVKQAELARRLGISPKQVSDTIKQYGGAR